MEYNEEEIIGMSEAYGMYKILPQEYQERIPKKFVERLEKYAKPDLGYPIESSYSLQSEKISREGVKLMAYMCLFLRDK